MSPCAIARYDRCLVTDIIPKKGGHCSFYCKLPQNQGFVTIKQVVKLTLPQNQ